MNGGQHLPPLGVNLLPLGVNLSKDSSDISDRFFSYGLIELQILGGGSSSLGIVIAFPRRPPATHRNILHVLAVKRPCSTSGA